MLKVTGNPVIPFHAEANSHWTVNSWDRTQIPKPFSTVALAMGEPLPQQGIAPLAVRGHLAPHGDRRGRPAGLATCTPSGL
jgi:hypothetical protein